MTRSRVRPEPDGPTPGSGPPGDPETTARTVCLRMLTAAPRTRVQLAEALAKRGIPDEVAQEVLDRFVEVGLIDDAAYAEAWVWSRHESRGLARRALAQELRRRGVANDVVQAAVDQLDPDDELAAARSLVERKLPSTRGVDRQRRVRRLCGMLARKGYSSGVALKAVQDAVTADEGADASVDDSPAADLDDHGM